MYKNIKGLDVDIFWNKCSYPANFGSYILKNDDDSTLFKTTDINDTNIVLKKLIFGEEMNYSIYVMPVSNNLKLPNQYFKSKNLSVFAGTPHEFRGKFFIPNGDLFYIITDGSINQYQKNDLSLTKRFQLPKVGEMNISCSGNYLLHRLSQSSIELYDLNSFTSINKFELTNLIPDLKSILEQYITNSGLCLIKYYNDKSSFNSIALIDLITGEVKYSNNFESSGFSFIVSPNGKYIFLKSSTACGLYGLKEGNLNLIFDLKPKFNNIKNFEFFRDDDNKAIITNDQTIFIVNLENLTITSDVKCTNGKIVNVDYDNNMLLIFKELPFVGIYSLIDSKLIKEIPSRYPYSLYLYNDYLYLSDYPNYLKININEVD